MKSLTAKDIMGSEVFTVRPEMNLAEVRELFLRHQISGAPVVGEEGELFGVISQTDLIRVALGKDIDELPEDNFWIGFTAWGSGISSETISDRLASKLVGDAVGGNVFKADEGTPVTELAKEMVRHHIHRLVITREGTVVGVVSTFDIIEAVAKL